MADIYNGEWELKSYDSIIKGDEIKIHSNELYDNYKNWAMEKGERKTTAKYFKQKLIDSDFLEYEDRFKINSFKRYGYKTTKDEIYTSFKEYITKKNIDNLNKVSPTTNNKDKKIINKFNYYISDDETD